MAKGAANESALGILHAKLAQTFTEILEAYEKQDEATEPNPAMLGAISKFLKDNSIAFDSEEIDVLSGTAQRLADRRANRQGIAHLSDLRVVDNG